MFKKVLSLLVAIVFSVSMIGGTVWASNITPYDISGHIKNSGLSISNKTATCTSSYAGADGECASIKIVQTLEKHSWLFFWDPISENTKTYYNTDDVYFKNYKYNLESGTYRVKSVFTVTLKDGRSETVTVYSGERTA